MFRPLYIHLPLQIVRERMDTLRSLGLHVEVYLDTADCENLHPGGLRALLSPLIDAGSRLHCHGPFDGSLMSRGEEERDRFLQASVLCLERCAECGIGRAVFHTGWEEEDQGGDWRNWLSRARKNWLPLKQASQRTGVQLAIENTFEERTEPVAELIEFLSPHAVFCVDLAHCHLSGGGLDPWLRDLSARLRHVHLSDCHGERDDHIGLGQGQLPLDNMIDSLKRVPAWREKELSAALEVNSEEGILLSLSFLGERGLMEETEG